MSYPDFFPNTFRLPAEGSREHVKAVVSEDKVKKLQQSMKEKADRTVSPELQDTLEALGSDPDYVADPLALGQELAEAAKRDDGKIGAFEQDLIATSMKTVSRRQAAFGDGNTFQFPVLAPTSSEEAYDKGTKEPLHNLERALGSLALKGRAAANDCLTGGDGAPLADVSGKAQRKIDAYLDQVAETMGNDPAMLAFKDGLKERLASIDGSGRPPRGSLTKLESLLDRMPEGVREQCKKVLSAYGKLERALSYDNRVLVGFASASDAMTRAHELARGDGNVQESAFAVIDGGPEAAGERFKVVRFRKEEFAQVAKLASDQGGAVMQAFVWDADSDDRVKRAGPALPDTHFGALPNAFDPTQALDPGLLELDTRAEAMQDSVLVGVGRTAVDVYRERMQQGIQRVRHLTEAGPDVQIATVTEMIKGRSDESAAKALSVLTGRHVFAAEVTLMRHAFAELDKRRASPATADERKAAIDTCYATSGLRGMMASAKESIPKLEEGAELALSGAVKYQGKKLLSTVQDPTFRKEVYDRCGFRTLPPNQFPPPGLDTDEAIAARAQAGGFANNAEMLFVQAVEDGDDNVAVMEPFVAALEFTVSLVPSVLCAPLAFAVETVSAVSSHVMAINKAEDQADQARAEALGGLTSVDAADKARQAAHDVNSAKAWTKVGVGVVTNAASKKVGVEVEKGTISEGLGRFSDYGFAAVEAMVDPPDSVLDGVAKVAGIAGNQMAHVVGQDHIGRYRAPGPDGNAVARSLGEQGSDLVGHMIGSRANDGSGLAGKLVDGLASVEKAEQEARSRQEDPRQLVPDLPPTQP